MYVQNDTDNDILLSPVVKNQSKSPRSPSGTYNKLNLQKNSNSSHSSKLESNLTNSIEMNTIKS